jgi:uncharacterized protein (DUF2336 family)
MDDRHPETRPPSASAPMGGRFGGIQSDYLYELARRRDPQARVELGNAVTNLFVEADLSLREQDIVSDILITMLKQAEIDLRRAISHRLAAVTKAPLRVVLYLANDDIDVAKPVLTSSPVLEDMDLMLIIETQGADYWRAIAERPDLRATVIQALAETRDIMTAKILMGNTQITIPPSAHIVFADLAHTANDLCVPLLKRADLPPTLVASVYAVVGAKIIDELRTSLPPEQFKKLEPHLVDVVAEHTAAANDGFEPTPPMIEAAKHLQQKGRLSIDGMIQSLRNGQIASFIAQMMVFVGTDLAAIKNMINDDTGKLMAAMCRLHRVDKKIYLKLFLLTQKVRTGDRVVDPMQLNSALSEFDMLPLSDARAMIDRLRSPV